MNVPNNELRYDIAAGVSNCSKHSILVSLYIQYQQMILRRKNVKIYTCVDTALIH